MFRHMMFHMQERGRCADRASFNHEGGFVRPSGPFSRIDDGPWRGRGDRGRRHSEMADFGRGGPFGRGFGPGGGRERMFDAGVMRLVILQQLAEEPSYGYQLIKKLEERMAGGYRPSAGVIYPTLTMLEEQGFTSASTNEAGKKVYSVTDEGRAFLDQNKERLAELEALMKAAGRGFQRGRSPEIMEAFMNLRTAVGAKTQRESLSAEQTAKIAEAINAAAKAIDEL